MKNLILILAGLFIIAAGTLAWSQTPLNFNMKPENAELYGKVLAAVNENLNLTGAAHEIYPRDFIVNPSNTQGGAVCESIGMKEVRAVLIYRDQAPQELTERGALQKMGFIACQGSDNSVLLKTKLPDGKLAVRPFIVTKINVVDARPPISQDVVRADINDPTRPDDCAVETNVSVPVCLEGYELFGYKNLRVGGASPGSSILAIAADPANPSCAIVTVHIKGKGYKEIDVFGGKIKTNDCQGKAYINIGVELLGAVPPMQYQLK